MINRIKRRLVFLFGTATSCILFLIVLLLFLSNRNEQNRMQNEMYQTNISNLIDTLAQTTQINTSWISQIQAKSNIMVLIKDNGNFLHLFSTYQTPVDPETLVAELTDLAAKDGFRQTLNSITSGVKRSSTYVWHKEDPISYRGTIAVFNSKTTRRTIYLIGVNEKVRGFFLQTALPYLACALLGSILLFLFNQRFISHILKPVQDGQKRQNEFISSVSHELKSPLSVVSAGVYNLQLLLNSPSVDESSLSRCRKSLPAIQNECARASRLINDMLLLAAADQKSWSINKEVIDLDTMMIDIYDHYVSLEEALQNKFQIKLPETELYQVYGDPERIHQIITILIDNAIRYTDPLRGITLSAFNQGDYVHIEVEDYGTGIPDSIKEKVFNRFYRLDTSRNQKQNFGLGLSIAKELTLLHNGRIYVKDTPGCGATFCIELPRHEDLN